MILLQNCHKQVYMVYHHVSFKDFYTFIFAQSFYIFLQIPAILCIYCFPSILWCKNDVIFAHPLCVCKAVIFICHKTLLVLYSSSVYRPSPRSVCYTVWRYCGLVSVSYHLMVTERLQPQSLCIVVNQLDTA